VNIGDNGNSQGRLLVKGKLDKKDENPIHEACSPDIQLIWRCHRKKFPSPPALSEPEEWEFKQR
jgi:hypothetical protein